MLSRLIPFSRLKTAYQASPRWVKRAYASIPHDLRAGREYRRVQGVIRETEFLDSGELRQRQGQVLRQLLQHAYENVPFYRELASVEPLKQKNIWESFARLPLISKKMLQESPKQFHAEAGIGIASYADNTGGSSGTPFAFRKSNNMYPVEQAYMLDQWRRVGYTPQHRKLTLRGRSFANDGGRRWQHNPIYNELMLSTYQLDAPTIRKAIPEIVRFQPQYIHGYPSAVIAFLQVLVDERLELPGKINAVLCGSEPLFDHQRSFIQEVLGCPAYSWYGQSECVILAGECESSRAYHAYPLYGIVEIVDETGTAIKEPGVEGEIVGTSLNNWAMPFIRYRTGDRGMLDEPGPCPACGRSFPRLKKVTGRTQDYVYTTTGRAVPVTAFVFGQHFDAFSRIRGMQVVQQEVGRVTVQIIPGPEFATNDESELRRKMERAVDGEIQVRIDCVTNLTQTAAGKTPFVVQTVRDPKVSSDMNVGVL